MKVLVIGSGGREHALARKFLASPKVEAVFCAPGNPGMLIDGIAQVTIAEDDHENLMLFAKAEAIDFTFVGPEIPLLNGIVDDFTAAGLKIFGPTKAAAMIEGSKEFAKKLMIENAIPTAAYQSFTDYDQAIDYLKQVGAPIVIKADGLAAGKGVVVAQDYATAEAALKEMLTEQKFGASSQKVVIEEFLAGEEFSLLAFVKGEAVYPMVIAQDHKRAYDHDQGPNTGGMGAYSPVPQIPQSIVDTAIKQILKPAARGMVKNGMPFNGILYAGLINTTTGPKVIEFNARFGDPETQVVLPRLDSDLAAVIEDLLNGREPQLAWNDKSCVGVVLAANGYPGSYQKGMTVPRFPAAVTTTYAGVNGDLEELTAVGGRVLLVEACGNSLREAQENVYAALKSVDTTDFFYRKDIANKAFQSN